MDRMTCRWTRALPLSPYPLSPYPLLGEQQLVDLVAVCGYYTLVAMMLATADVHTSEPPDGGALILI